MSALDYSVRYFDRNGLVSHSSQYASLQAAQRAANCWHLDGGDHAWIDAPNFKSRLPALPAYADLLEQHMQLRSALLDLVSAEGLPTDFARRDLLIEAARQVLANTVQP